MYLVTSVPEYTCFPRFREDSSHSGLEVGDDVGCPEYRISSLSRVHGVLGRKRDMRCSIERYPSIFSGLFVK